MKTESLERRANEDMWQEFLPINLGNWEKTNLRAMSRTVVAPSGRRRTWKVIPLAL